MDGTELPVEAVRRPVPAIHPDRCGPLGGFSLRLLDRELAEKAIGRDLGEPENARLLVRQALMLALGIMGVGALIIWFAIGRIESLVPLSTRPETVRISPATPGVPVAGGMP